MIKIHEKCDNRKEQGAYRERELEPGCPWGDDQVRTAAISGPEQKSAKLHAAGELAKDTNE